MQIHKYAKKDKTGEEQEVQAEQAFLSSSSSPQTKNTDIHMRDLLPGVQRTSCLPQTLAANRSRGRARASR